MTDVGTKWISGTSTLRISDVVRYLLFISGIATLLEMVVHVEEKYFDVKVQVILCDLLSIDLHWIYRNDFDLQWICHESFWQIPCKWMD